MSKLNQIIAIEKGIKSRVYAKLTEINKAVQKPALFNGFSRTYQPRDDAEETLPPERQRVQFSASDLLKEVSESMGELMDITARKDWTNCVAAGDVIVDGKVLLPNTPISHLLFLEKQLTDLRTLVENLPILDDAEDWQQDENSGLFRATPTQTHRTKKVAKAIVLYPATEQHPAQTQMVQEDVIAGFWSQLKQSGAWPKPQRDKLVSRVETTLRAVKQAREMANMVDESASTPKVSATIFKHLLDT